MVEVTDDHTEKHLRHTENNRKFHFIRIQEKNFVLRQLPNLQEVKEMIGISKNIN